MAKYGAIICATYIATSVAGILLYKKWLDGLKV